MSPCIYFLDTPKPNIETDKNELFFLGLCLQEQRVIFIFMEKQSLDFIRREIYGQIITEADRNQSSGPPCPRKS